MILKIFSTQKEVQITFKEKRVLKQCPGGTILENGAFFYKKGTISVPLGHQNKVVPPDKRAPGYRGLILRGAGSQEPPHAEAHCN